jgi:hypothetical protein
MYEMHEKSDLDALLLSSALDLPLAVTRFMSMLLSLCRTKKNSRKSAILSLPTILLDYVALELPLRRCLWVRCNLHDLSRFSLPPDTENALANLIVRC